MRQFSELQRGVLPDNIIEQFLDSGFIINSKKSNIQPASLDINLDLNKIFEVDKFYLPREGERVENIINCLSNQGYARRITNGLLKQGKKYIIRIVEEIIGMPFYMRMNPKSSPGRLFTLSRLITDGYSAYDECYPSESVRCHWILVSPKKYNTMLCDSESLSQLRFFKGNDRLSRKELEREMQRENFLILPPETQPSLFNNGLNVVKLLGNEIGSHLLTVDFSCDIVGYKTKSTNETVYLKSRELDPGVYFEPIYKDQLVNGMLLLEEGEGYLFGSLERIKLPKHLAAEVVPFSEKYGEHRTHFAGFIDPWFGGNTEFGNSITFEVIASEKGACLRHGQPIGEIQYEYMSSIPEKVYEGNYNLQQSGPQLSKYFKK